MSELPDTDDLVTRAIARLDARRWTLRCGGCGHEDEVPSDPERVADYRCDQCGTVTAFGVAMPKITINPHADRRFVVARFEQRGSGGKSHSFDLTLERQYAVGFLMEMLSVCDPELYAICGRVVGMVASAKERAERVARGEVPKPAGQALDAPLGS